MKALICLIMATLCVGFSFAQAPDTLWYRTYGGANRDGFDEVIITSENGLALYGTTASYPTCGAEDTWLVKTDPNGNVQWTSPLSVFCTNSYENGQSVIQTSDGGYAMAGISNRTNQLSTQAFLIKANSLGNGEWVREYGDSYWNEGSYSSGCVKQTADGGYIIAAFTAAYCPANDHSLYMIKTNSLGYADWANCYGGSGWDGAEDVQIDAYGDYWVTGYTSSMDTHGGNDAFLFRFDQGGGLAEQHTYGGSANEGGRAIRMLPDGGFILAGNTTSYGGGGTDFYIVRIDPAGNELWHRTYGGSGDDGANAIELISDGGYIVVGSWNWFGTGNTDSYIVRLNSSGDTLWTKIFGGTGNDWATDVKVTPTGEYLVCGWTESSGAGNYDGYLLKIASDVPAVGHVTLITAGPPDWSYRLNWIGGAISSVKFTDFCPGTVGSVTGPAGSHWTVVNYPDSIVFSSPIPLTSGLLDTFVLSHPWCSDVVSWTVGDSTGSVDGPLPVELLSFDATAMNGSIRLSFATASENNNDHFEIMRSVQADVGFNHIAMLPSQGNSATEQHYEYIDTDIGAEQTYWYYLVDVDLNGNRTEHRDRIASAAAVSAPTLPTEYALYQNYPNPFNPVTTIAFDLKTAGFVSLKVYNLNGQEIRNPLHENRIAGHHEVNFDASGLPSGVYLYTIKIGGFTDTKKMLLMK